MERKVTPRSSLTAAERKRRDARIEAARKWEIRETQISRRNEQLRRMYPDWGNPVSRPPIPYEPRPPRPDMRDLPRPTPAPPNGGGPGGIIEGQLSRPPSWGKNIPWSMRDNLKWQLRRLGRLLGYGNPWLRALNTALDAYDFWKFVQEYNRGPGGASAPGWDMVKCNGGPGDLINIANWAGALNACPAPYYLPERASLPTANSWPYFNYDRTDQHGTFKTYHMGYPAFRLIRQTGTVGAPALSIKPYTGNLYVPQFPYLPAPNIPVPYRTLLQLPHPDFSPEPLNHQRTKPGRPRPIPPLPGPPHKPRPPGKGEKEKKVRVPAALMGAFRAATMATEAIDLLDALLEALPPKYRKGVEKSGRTDKRARLGEGVAYSTPWDKFKHLLKNWRHIDMPTAVKEIIKNQIEDKLIGGLNRGADKTRDQAGGIGWTYNL